MMKIYDKFAFLILINRPVINHNLYNVYISYCQSHLKYNNIQTEFNFISRFCTFIYEKQKRKMQIK